jgi:hypothetical protein
MLNIVKIFWEMMWDTVAGQKSFASGQVLLGGDT